ncbi:MAG: multidrug efflux RND transporter permease subunit [Myxococcales bacterium]
MAAFFIRRPIVAIVIALLTTLLGVVSILGLPISQYPEIVPPQVQLTTTYTGADAVTIEQAVATPIEQQMNGVDKSLYIQSINANDGTMTQNVTFDVDSDIDIDNVLVQNRFSQAQAQLPQDVKNYGVTIKKSLAFPLIVFSFYSPDGRYDANFLSNYALINVNDVLARIKGVGDIVNFGSSQYALRIWLKPDLMARLGLTVNDVQAAVRAQNTVNPAGRVGAEPATPGTPLTYTVRAQGRLVTPEEFEAIILRQTPDGSLVSLRDVARVELGALTYGQAGAYNGKPAAVVAAFQSPGSNALEVASEIQAKLAELKERFPPGLEYAVSLDTTLPVKGGIEEILQTLFEAVILVVIVVFVFLQSFRATLIPLLTVPVSLIGAFAIFPLLGFSINTLSLFGLVLAIGLVVDDAIVVVEAVQHHIEQGLSPKEATLKAMSEVSAPVIGIALILAAVFVPVAFMGGITGRLYQQFALTIAISVLISAFNALTLSPALSAMLLRPKQEARGFFGRAGRRFNAWFERTTEGYVRVNRLLMRKLAIPLLLLAGVTGIALLSGSRLPSGFVPDEDQGYLVVGVQLPSGASLERTRSVFRQMESVISKTEGVRAYNSIAGFSILTRTTATYSGTAFVGLKPWKERGRALDAKAIAQKLNIAFSKIPGATLFAVLPPAIPGISATGGFSMMLQDRSGSTVDYLATHVQRFVTEAHKRKELTGVLTTFSADVPQLFAEVDKEKALKVGVPLPEIYGALQTFWGGVYINDFTRFGRQWRVFAQAAPEYREKTDDLTQLHVRNVQGEMVPLSTLVRMRSVSGPEYTSRFNLYRAAEVLGQPAPGYSSGQALDALEEVAKNVLPSGMGYDWNALSYQERIAGGNSARALALSLVFVFLILAALYESWSLPFSVLLSTPVAILGAYLGLLSRRFDNNVFAQIGLVMLVGLTAKNAILIVEFAKLRLEQGQSLMDAAIEAARLRLRPILMTSFAFIAGCLPLWFASGAGAGGRRIMGTTVVSGMLAATLLGIFFVPSLFVFIERLMSVNAQRRQRRRGRRQRALHPGHAE